MRVKNIKVKKLFGVFDHEIPLQSAERVTIVHGPNGFGKTIILKMIKAVANGSTKIFESTPFEDFRLTFDDNTCLVVTPGKPDEQGRVRIQTAFRDGNGKPIALVPRLEDPPDSVLDRLDRSVPSPFGRFGHGWRNQATGEVHSLAEIIKLFPPVAKLLPEKYRPHPFPLPLGALNLFFVEANRLTGTPGGEELEIPDEEAMRMTVSAIYHERQRAEREKPRVEQYSEDLVQRIRSVLADYAKHSQERDRTFPERLVQFVRSGSKVMSEGDIIRNMTELETKRQRLISLGFLDSESGLRGLKEEDVRRTSEALTIYVGDVQEKLRVFDELATRAGKLTDIVNERFHYKRLKIHRQRGFDISSDVGQLLPLNALSSGEQHELVLLYELLFRTPKDGLVLVDEPEISFHVAWQSRFLKDLIAILELTNAYAIVATHSPVVIGARSDLTVELQGPGGSRTTAVQA